MRAAAERPAPRRTTTRRSLLGTLRARVEIPAEDEGLHSATNVAIAPGTTTAYVTVSGPAGGFLYRFEAPGEGIRATNGG